MKVEKLTIRNFRNISQIDLAPKPGLNLFTGYNGQGKTNLLEAIFVLTSGSSFRRASDPNLVKNETDGYMLGAGYTIEGRKLETEIRYSINGSKRILINNKKVGLNHKDRLRVVIFTPDDLFLIKGSPSKRRAFLDFILRQISSEYFYNLDNYMTILKKRNIFLKKEQTSLKSFKIVNDLFVENSARLIIQRLNFINILEEICRPIYSQLNEAQCDMKMKYALSFNIESDKINMEVLQTALHKHIEEHQGEEMRRKTTLVGPHLEDINVYHDSQLAQIYASQGQQRNISICMKLAELHAFHSIKGFFPLLLLDDVLSELDDLKKTRLMAYLRQAEFQTFLTAINTDGTNTEGIPHWRVEGGRLH
ncbi:MAG: DNA replication and repair protein RecF [Syntrophomonadaceae bacterium]